MEENLADMLRFAPFRPNFSKNSGEGPPYPPFLVNASLRSAFCYASLRLAKHPSFYRKFALCFRSVLEDPLFQLCKNSGNPGYVLMFYGERHHM